MRLYVHSDLLRFFLLLQSFTARFECTPKWRNLVITLLMPRETAAVQAHVLCTPYNHAPVYSITSCEATCIRRLHMCLDVTCHLRFWQNDRDLLRATAVTRGWNVNQNKSQHRKLTLEKTILPSLLSGLEPATFLSRGRRCTTELTPGKRRAVFSRQQHSYTHL